jgi:bisphosphoglycerate-independent phosphoglycerate mutase (AlkP superfamily)
MEGRTLLLNKTVQTKDTSPKAIQEELTEALEVAIEKVKEKRSVLHKVRITAEVTHFGLYVETVITLPVEAE